MSLITDPAKELAQLCNSLTQSVDQKGDDYLAAKFNVDPWSVEFYKIIFCIIERIEEVQSISDTLEIDDDIKSNLKNNFSEIRRAFSKESLVGNWKPNGGPHFLRRENTGPIMMLSPLMRQKVTIPLLSPDEIQELLTEVQELEAWLNEHQLVEQDFIRQAIIDGLENFRFSLEHLNWVGIGYTLKSLREVIGAYLALERGLGPEADYPDSHAVLKKIGALCQSFYDKIEAVRKAKLNADFMLELYGAGSLYLDAQTVSGFLTQG